MFQAGKYIIKLDSVDSTNNYASKLIEKDKPEEGTVIMTDYQEQGRGQRETVWESERGRNLMASFIFYPEMDVSDNFLFNQCIALALHDMIEKELGKEVKIKWSNDIMVNDKKIAGILIENSIRGNTFLFSIAGMGINVNQKEFKKYSPQATSFLLEKQKHFIVSGLLNKLCRSLTKWYNILNDENYELISTSYSNQLYRKDELHWYEIANERIKATIKGVNDDGRLLLEKENGELLKLNFKEVKYLY